MELGNEGIQINQGLLLINHDVHALKSKPNSVVIAVFVSPGCFQVIEVVSSENPLKGHTVFDPCKIPALKAWETRVLFLKELLKGEFFV